MPKIIATVEREVPAPAKTVFDLLVDYKFGHPLILPEPFVDYRVLEGGYGAGTRIGYGLQFGPRKEHFEAIVSIPDPGRRIVESDVEPAGKGCVVGIGSAWAPSRGVAGYLESLLIPRVLRSLFNQELILIETVAPPWQAVASARRGMRQPR